MVDVSTVFKRAYIRHVYTHAHPTLLDRLEHAQHDAIHGVEKGLVISSTSSKGHSVSFSEPGKGGPTPAQIVELCEELLTLYYEVDAISGVDTDAERLAEMLHRLKPVTSFRKSFTSIRLAGGTPAVSQ